ncbi:MAG: hypothetical protein [Microvirus sp.]|nr:MAG: hypothetical protein [Microvirus sp.]
MMPLKRKPVSKGAAASKFRRHVSHTKHVNVAPPPQRGGYRL